MYTSIASVRIDSRINHQASLVIVVSIPLYSCSCALPDWFRLTSLLSSPFCRHLTSSFPIRIQTQERDKACMTCHPKGTGVICKAKKGLKADTFVTEYLG